MERLHQRLFIESDDNKPVQLKNRLSTYSFAFCFPLLRYVITSMERSNKLVDQALTILREHSQFQISQAVEEANVADEVLSYPCIYIKFQLVIIMTIVMYLNISNYYSFNNGYLQNNPQHLPSHDMLVLLTDFIAVPANGIQEVNLQVSLMLDLLLFSVCIWIS